jgi:pimeloyl-ACP methyl ester carboxylesterase
VNRYFPSLPGVKFAAVLVAFLLAVVVFPQPARAESGLRCFAETGLCMRGRIREFWEQNGGLTVFGLPITPQQRETVEGKAVYVQWFERNRIELHPHNAPPYDVLLGRLGGDRIEQRTRSRSVAPGGDTSPPPTVSLPNDDSCRFFAETGFSVCGEFLAAWRAHGLELDNVAGTSKAESLALFGLPLTEPRTEMLEDGKEYTVQWFERARFEQHPEPGTPRRVQFGLLGSEQLGQAWQDYPRFESSACPFRVPGDLTIECGYLTVPEDRSQPDSRMIQLAVARVPTRSATPAPDPLIYLSGGPGSAALVHTVTYARGWSWFLANRDFLMIDQRGTGFSHPALLCPELAQLAKDLLGQNVTRAEKVRAEVDTALQCRNRLVREGVAVAGYTSAASAADLNDLRVALGYDQVNLFGISYGTRLALTAMRDYPETIRSVVLDSTYPLQINLFTAMPANLERSLRTLFTNCARTPSCNRAYPDLERVFHALVAQLNANPVTLWPRDPHSGRAVRVHMDGTELISLMFRLFYDSQVINSLPRMIFEARNGNYTLLTQMQQRRLGRMGGGFSHGAYFSIECSEEIAFTNEDEVNATRTAYPHLQPFFEGIPENTPEIFRLCEGWQVHPPDPVENEPVVSDIPTLILAGEYDPITPPGWGQIAVQTLSRGTVFPFADTGHAVISRGSCPQSLIRAFLADPLHPPDGSCVPVPVPLGGAGTATHLPAIVHLPLY